MEYVKGESQEAVLDREKSLDVPRAVAYTVQILRASSTRTRTRSSTATSVPRTSSLRERGREGGGLRDLAAPREIPRDHRHRQPALHGARAVPGAGRARVDIYSVGVIALPDAHGDAPLLQPNPAQIEKMVAQGRCTPPRLRNGSIPREISDIVMKAIAPELPNRYQHASELLEDLATAGEIDTRRRRWRTSGSASRRARCPRRAFAGTAASPCTRGPTRARSAARNSKAPVTDAKSVHSQRFRGDNGVDTVVLGDLESAGIGWPGPRGAPENMSFPKSDVIWMNGTLVPWDDARSTSPPTSSITGPRSSRACAATRRRRARRSSASTRTRASLQLREDLPHGRAVLGGRDEPRPDRDGGRQQDGRLLHPTPRLPRVRPARRQPLSLPGGRGGEWCGTGGATWARRRSRRASTCA